MSTGSFFINAFCIYFLFFENDLHVKISICTMYYISFIVRDIDHKVRDEYHSHDNKVN